MPFVDLQHRFHYVEHPGLSPAVLLLHSTGIGSRQWKEYATLLSSRHLLMVDLLGYPPSDFWEEGFSLKADLDVAVHLLQRQDSPVDVIGHSYGGFLALKLAKEHPAKVRRLLLHEPVAWGALYDSPNDDLKRDFDALCQLFFDESTSRTSDDWLRTFIDYWNVEGTWSAFPEKTKTIWRRQFPKVYAEVSLLCLDRTPLAYWHTIDHPTYITVSDNSPPQEREVCRLLASCLPQAQLIEHAGGHLAPLTHLSEMAPIVKAWSQQL